MSAMTERRTARRYDLTLPISIRFASESLVSRQDGRTLDISTRGLYFIVSQDLQAGSELDITLTLPAEVTHGSDVLVRAQGKVVRVEPRLEEGETRMGVAAVIERYDIMRGDMFRAKSPRTESGPGS
jgi:c-di-GMP-binding flagellar brake protein YcgR